MLATRGLRSSAQQIAETASQRTLRIREKLGLSGTFSASEAIARKREEEKRSLMEQHLHRKEAIAQPDIPGMLAHKVLPAGRPNLLANVPTQKLTMPNRPVYFLEPVELLGKSKLIDHLEKLHMIKFDPDNRTALVTRNVNAKFAMTPGSIVLVRSINSKTNPHTRIFMGVCIRVRREGLGSSFTLLRHFGSGAYVEITFPLYSPLIQSIDILKRAKFTKGNLNYLRDDPKKFERIEEKTYGLKPVELMETSFDADMHKGKEQDKRAKALAAAASGGKAKTAADKKPAAKK